MRRRDTARSLARRFIVRFERSVSQQARTLESNVYKESAAGVDAANVSFILIYYKVRSKKERLQHSGFIAFVNEQNSTRIGVLTLETYESL